MYRVLYVKGLTQNQYAMNHPAGRIGKRLVLKVTDVMKTYGEEARSSRVIHTTTAPTTTTTTTTAVFFFFFFFKTECTLTRRLYLSSALHHHSPPIYSPGSSPCRELLDISFLHLIYVFSPYHKIDMAIRLFSHNGLYGLLVC